MLVAVADGRAASLEKQELIVEDLVALATLRTGRQIWSRASGTCASAASVNVPAGPR